MDEVMNKVISETSTRDSPKPPSTVTSGDVIEAGVFPPPMEKVTEEVSSVKTIALDEETPGALKLDRSGRLLKTYINYRGINPFIAAYDEWLAKELPKQLLGPFTMSGNFAPFYEFYFTNVRLEKPMFKGNIMTPLQARQNSRNYMLKVVANIEMRTYLGTDWTSRRIVQSLSSLTEQVKEMNQKGVPKTSHIEFNKTLCEIPLMVGSKNCILFGKTAEELAELGESPHDPFGNFIINGESKGIQLVKGLRFNIPIISIKNKDKELVCKMTCSTIRGTSNLKIIVPEEETGLDINLQFMGRNASNKLDYYPIYLIFQVLWAKRGETTPLPVETVKAFIKIFIKSESDKIRSKKILDGLESGTKTLDNLVKKLKTRSTYKGYNEEQLRAVVEDLIVEDTFPQMSVHRSDFTNTTIFNTEYKNSLLRKMYMLGFMAARLIEYHLGSRPMDDIDDWGNIKLESPAELLKQLFNSVWKITAKAALNKYREKLEKTDSTINPTDLASLINSKLILKTFTTSLSKPDDWGISTTKNIEGFKKTNISTPLGSESPTSLLSFMTKIVSSVNSNSSNTALRDVQQTQFGYIDPIQTPEGGKCGLVVHLAMTTRITTFVDPAGLINAIKRVKDGFSSNPTTAGHHVLIVNGSLLGWCDAVKIKDLVIKIRRNPDYQYTDVAVWIDEADHALYIYTNEGRLVRPLLVLDNEEHPVIAKKNLWEADFTTLLREGAVEYLDVKEHNKMLIATSMDFLASRQNRKIRQNIYNDIRLLKRGPDELNIREFSPFTQNLLKPIDISKPEEINNIILQLEELYTSVNQKRKYSHMEISPDAIFGYAVALSPYPGHSPAPRHTMQANMSQQALTKMEGMTYRTPTTGKSMMTPTPPLVTTQAQNILGLTEVGMGQSVVLMMLPYESTNIEDAVLWNKRSLDLGKFRMVVHHTYEALEKKSLGGLPQVFGKPSLKPRDDPRKYDHLNERGLPRIGTKLGPGDIVIGMIIKGHPEKDRSVKLGVGEEGVVESVIVGNNENAVLMVRVKIRQYRIPQYGDKFAARYSQKGTIGTIVKPEDLPFMKDGTIPDVVINPHAIPSRMTIGLLIEMVAGTYAGLTGNKQDATLYKTYNEAEFMRALVGRGYTRELKTKVYWGHDFMPMNGLVSVGLTYYLALKHMVEDKWQVRAEGKTKYTNLDYATRMPGKSRKKKGGLRVGEMERNALIIHGASNIINTKMCLDSNPINLVVCKKCGKDKVSNPRVNYMCNVCGLQTAGEGFTEVTTRYTLVYLTNLLAVAGIDIRLITEEK